MKALMSTPADEPKKADPSSPGGSPPSALKENLKQGASDHVDVVIAAAKGAARGGVAGAVMAGGKALAKSKTGKKIGMSVACSAMAWMMISSGIDGMAISSQAQEQASTSQEHDNQGYAVATTESEDEGDALRTIHTAASRASAPWEVLAAIHTNIKDRSEHKGTGPMGIDKTKIDPQNPISDEHIESLEESAKYVGMLLNSALNDAAPDGLNNLDLDAGYKDATSDYEPAEGEPTDEPVEGEPTDEPVEGDEPAVETESLRVETAVVEDEDGADAEETPEDGEETAEADPDPTDLPTPKPLNRAPVDTEEAEKLREQIKTTYIAAIASLPLEPNPDMAEDIFNTAHQWSVGKQSSPQSSDQCGPGDKDSDGGEVELGGETTVDLNDSQKKYAQIIINRAATRGMSQTAAVVALATAMQESTLRMWWNANVPGSEELTQEKDAKGSDGYSVGLFQQQVHGNDYSWGTVEEAMDPKKSTDMFLDRLETIEGWERLTVSQAAQQVQASAHPDAYAKWESMARQLVNDLKPTEGYWKDSHDKQPVKATSAKFTTLSVTAEKKETKKEDKDEKDGDKDEKDGEEEFKLPSRLVVNPMITPDARATQNAVGSRFHEYISSWGDIRAGGDDHGQKRAIDFMIKDYKSETGIKGGDEISAFLIANDKALGVEYIIWRDKIWLGASTGWKEYSTGSYGKMYEGNWNDTTLHNDHVHVTLYGNKGTGGDFKYESPDGVTSPCPSGNGPTPPATGTGPGAGNGDDYPYRDPQGVCGYCSEQIDPWSMYIRECVSFVAWRMNQQMGWKEGQPYPFTKTSMGIGNAREWSGALSARGYITDSNPTVGSIAWWESNQKLGVINTGPAGHVAVVTEVLEDGNIVIEQYNGPGSEWAYNTMTLHKSKVTGFIHVADIPQKKPGSVEAE